MAPSTTNLISIYCKLKTSLRKAYHVPITIWKQLSHKTTIDKIYFCRKKQIALTFDDGQTNAFEIFQQLEKYHVKATFFVSGAQITQLTDVYQQINKAGHEIANHTYTHPRSVDLSESGFLAELEKNEQYLKKLTGKQCNLFRFPYGSSNEGLLHLVAKNKLIPIGWTVNPHDWQEISAEEICQRIMENNGLRCGAILLLHTQGKNTAAALDLLIPKLQTMGYELLRVSDLLKQSPIYKHML